MKKLLIGAVSAIAMSFVLAGSANAAPNWSQVCKDNNNFGVSHGECTSILNGFNNKVQGNNDAAAYCKAIKATDPAFFDANFKNVGACITVFAPLLPG